MWEGFLLLPGEEVEPAGMFAVLDELGIHAPEERRATCRAWQRLAGERARWWRQQVAKRRP